MPDARVLLGVDLGSSGVKAVLLDPARGIVASATREVTQFSDHPGWSEADPAQWWDALGQLVPGLLGAAGLTAGDVAAVAVSGMVPAVVLCDAQGNPLRRAILQNDARAIAEVLDVREALGGLDLLNLSGSELSHQSVAPTVLWLARHEPEVWGATASLCGSYDWLARRLGATPHVERNWALESGLYSIDIEPLEAVRAATGVAWPELLGVARPGEVVGAVSTEAAYACGLRVGTPIVVGGADHVLSAYGAGLTSAGDCLVKLGGAGDILCVSDSVVLDARLYLDYHPVPGKWLPNGCMATSGSLIRWEQALLGGPSLERLDDEAARSQPAALLALPYFLGEKTPLNDPELRGALIGMHLGTTRGDIHRAFLEAIAFGFKSHVEVFQENGLNVTRIVVTNGGSRSRLWRQIVADVLDRELISLVDHPGASFGAAVAAGVGVGLIADWTYVQGALATGESIAPNADLVARYAQRYAEFVGFTAASTPFSHLLARSTT